jgi:hypothetical protein
MNEIEKDITELVEGLADQQAMPDDSWRPRLVSILADLAARPTVAQTISAVLEGAHRAMEREQEAEDQP